MQKTYTEQPINNIGNETTNDSFPFIVFGIPILIVCFVTWLKYNTRHKLSLRELSNLLLDLCVDTLTVGVTILAAYYSFVGSSSILFWNCVSFAVVTLFVIFVRSLHLGGELSSKSKRLVLVLLCCVSCFGVMFFLYTSVC